MDDLDEFYRNYGETLASRLPEIAHSSAKKAFVFVTNVDDPAEAQTFSTKAPIGQPFLAWDNFDEDLNTSGRDNYHLAIKGSFSLWQKATDKVTQAQVYANCRKIVLKALSVMIADSEEGVLEAEGIVMEINQIPMEKTGPLNATWYGYGAQFSWLVPIDLTLGEDDLLPV